MYFCEEKAQRVIDFIQLLKHTKGKWAGKNFVLLPWELDFIRQLFGTLRDDGTRQYRTGYLEIPKKSGKALALDTPIPTPNGWTTMGDLRIGDTVFGEDGLPCVVTNATDVMIGHNCCEVVFSDGCKIVADEEHLWRTNAWIDSPGGGNNKKNNGARRYRGSISGVRTTAQIRDTLCINRNTTNNHSVDVAKCIVLPDADLPVPPYTFGAWLGDGASRSASITCCDADVELLEYIHAEGIPTTRRNERGITHSYGLSDGIRTRYKDCVEARLRNIGVLQNKHIPTIYLRASGKQRMELLRGLMDTDGCCNRTSGECEFITISPRLRDDVLELLASLGFKATCSQGIARCNGKDCGVKYRIRFFSFSDNPCFHLHRKATRLKQQSRSTRSGVRKIIAVNNVPSVPVRCIQVGSPSHLYLAGKSMIPTHNSELGAAIALYMLTADGEDRAEVYGAACDTSQASIVYETACHFVGANPDLNSLLHIVPSRKRIVFQQNGSFYQVLSSDVKSKSGLNVSCAIIDEIWTHPSPDLIEMLTTGSGDAREQPLFLYLTTAGNKMEGIGWDMHKRALDVLSGKREDPTFLPVVYGLNEDDDWEDERNWKKANPSIGHTITLDRVRDQYIEAKGDNRKIALFKQLRLNMWLRQNVKWMVADKWRECAFPVNRAALRGRRCYAGLDLSSTEDVTALVLVFPPEEENGLYQVLPFFWIPEDTISERARKDAVKYELWRDEGLVCATDGKAVNYTFLKQSIMQLATEFEICEIACDRWNATHLVQELSDEGANIFFHGQGYRDMSPPTKELIRLTLDKKLAHGGHPVLEWMVDNVYLEMDAAGNVKPNKGKSSEKIDGAVAMIMAIGRAIINQDSSQYAYDGRDLVIL